uniref:ADP-ribosylation factor n=1 Tax=Leptobrachium leishanense TaxID=445787 RepID=A0A8C5R4W9_9ANUR
MGGLGSRIQGFCGRTYAMNARVLMVGLDGAGKTTILYRLKLNKTVSTIPNISHRVETLDLTPEPKISHPNLGLEAWLSRGLI